MKIYGVFDVVKGCYAPPFVARNDADATRMFMMDCKKLPFINDLKLKCIGEIDLDYELNPISITTTAYDVPVDLGDEK